ncbi:MAG: hypothetical protein KF833_23905 [Verrucomicrobiae bacterium]|nr:hypothetical protein [Verrucomicrobiae bacterium]
MKSTLVTLGTLATTVVLSTSLALANQAPGAGRPALTFQTTDHQDTQTLEGKLVTLFDYLSGKDTGAHAASAPSAIESRDAASQDGLRQSLPSGGFGDRDATRPGGRPLPQGMASAWAIQPLVLVTHAAPQDAEQSHQAEARAYILVHDPQNYAGRNAVSQAHGLVSGSGLYSATSDAPQDRLLVRDRETPANPFQSIGPRPGIGDAAASAKSGAKVKVTGRIMDRDGLQAIVVTRVALADSSEKAPEPQAQERDPQSESDQPELELPDLDEPEQE